MSPFVGIIGSVAASKPPRMQTSCLVPRTVFKLGGHRCQRADIGRCDTFLFNVTVAVLVELRRRYFTTA